MRAGDFTDKGVDIFVDEKIEFYTQDMIDKIPPQLLKPTRGRSIASDFRLINGNQIVGGAYTLVNVSPTLPDPLAWDGKEREKDESTPNTYVAELGIREGSLRIRGRFLFSQKNTADNELLEFSGVNIIREFLPHTSPNELEYINSFSVGKGIYDPQARGDPYYEVNIPGRIALLFPRFLKTNERFVITIDWQGKFMRYQADRKFSALTGMIKSLELTEIRPQDADIYTNLY
jgi:hypothetical protein